MSDTPVLVRLLGMREHHTRATETTTLTIELYLSQVGRSVRSSRKVRVTRTFETMEEAVNAGWAILDATPDANVTITKDGQSWFMPWVEEWHAYDTDDDSDGF